MCATCIRDIEQYKGEGGIDFKRWAADRLAAGKGNAVVVIEQAPEPVAVELPAAAEQRIPGLLGAWVLVLAMVFAAVLCVIFGW